MVPTKGGYAAILVFAGEEEEIVADHDTKTTNNRMEMLVRDMIQAN